MAAKKLPGLEKFVRNLREGKTKLKVGFLNKETAEVAIKNEFGGVFTVDEDYKNRAKSKGVNVSNYISIPPRPFMLNTINNHSREWSPLFAKIVTKYDYDINKSLYALGEIIKSQVQSSIRDGSYTSNSANTVKIKGFDKPLIDGGNMLRSIAAEVE